MLDINTTKSSILKTKLKQKSGMTGAMIIVRTIGIIENFTNKYKKDFNKY